MVIGAFPFVAVAYSQASMRAEWSHHRTTQKAWRGICQWPRANSLSVHSALVGTWAV